MSRYYPARNCQLTLSKLGCLPAKEKDETNKYRKSQNIQKIEKIMEGNGSA
jgi:hypothetical protein